MQSLLRRAFAQPARGVLRLLLCALSAFALAGALSSLSLLREATGPATRFDLHAAKRLDRTYDRLRLFDVDSLEKLSALVPGVRSIALYESSLTPVLERAGDRFELYSMAHVSPEYFALGDVQLVAGDFFGWDEVDFGDRVALISESAAELIFPDGGAVGGEVVMMPARAPYRIVGVYRRPGTGPGPGLLVPPTPGVAYGTVAVAAEPGRAAEVRRDIVAAARSIYSEELERAGYPSGNDFLINSAGEFGSEASPARRTLTSLTLIGVVSLVVAGMGVFSMATVEVAQRQRAVGLQRAMGASRARVVASLVSDAAVMGVAGAAAGLLLALVALPQLEPGTGLTGAVARTNLQVDPATAAATVAVIALLCVLASIVPAVQAVRHPPVAALREA